MLQQSNQQRYRPFLNDGVWRVQDTVDGQFFPAKFPSWASANRDAQRRNRGDKRPFQPNLKQVQAKFKTA